MTEGNDGRQGEEEEVVDVRRDHDPHRHRGIDLRGMTPTQRRIVKVLADGQLHWDRELLQCLGDSYASVKNLAVHLTAIRKLLTHQGRGIVTQRIARGEVRYLLAEAVGTG